MIRSRFAPSPTGFLHIGGARTALFAYAYARKNNGKFILRIEDTDLERSTLESVQSILDAMQWLDLSYDEGPYYQTKRFDRYKEVIQELLNQGNAYHCYCSKQELDEMRQAQIAQGLKPKYDRRCLHNPQPKSGVNPVVRFKNPTEGSVVWDDLVKGRIEVSNQELDDLIIARSDGSPTYNFCVVVDDFDMEINYVIRGDDHVNNTPRQINILHALNAKIPNYAHLPMILRDDGQKMSKRTDAVSVMQYKDMGILPQALLNYLARLCWGHKDDEIFDIEQFIQWFELTDVSPSPARFDLKKLMWVNSEHIKKTSDATLVTLIASKLTATGLNLNSINLEQIIALTKTRVDNLNALCNECEYFYNPQPITDHDKDKFLDRSATEILTKFAAKIDAVNIWNLDNIKQTIKDFCANENVKMPQLGMPLRLKLCGTTQTPSFDAIIHILGKEIVLKRISR